jgi:hypothetical protein
MLSDRAGDGVVQMHFYKYVSMQQLRRERSRSLQVTYRLLGSGQTETKATLINTYK